MRIRGVLIPVVAAVLVLSGCGGSAQQSVARRLGWQEVSVPTRAGWNVAIRALVHCDHVWFATGALVADGQTQPAAWSSQDGRQWTPIPTVAETYYGARNTLYSAACRGRQLVALGARSGGAHGNPRISTWYTAADGRLMEVEARPYTLFGGLDAVNTSRVVAGPQGFLLTGNRVTGAAVWLSGDGSRFDIVEAAPGLASDPGAGTYGTDGVAVDDSWLVVGSRTPAAGTRDPAAWTSTDGRTWVAEAVPADSSYEELQRVVTLGGEQLAIGPRGSGVGVWRRSASGAWSSVTTFSDAASTVPMTATALVTVGPAVASLVQNAARHELWWSDRAGRAWHPVPLPAPAPATAASVAVLAMAEGRVLLGLDGGSGSRLWVAPLPQ